jgi:NADH-quinone oxidoreductase subunit L
MRIAANKAALKAMIINRIADVFFILAIGLILIVFKTMDFVIVFSLVPQIIQNTCIFINNEISVILIISIFLLIGGIGKSAQIGLHT